MSYSETLHSLATAWLGTHEINPLFLVARLLGFKILSPVQPRRNHLYSTPTPLQSAPFNPLSSQTSPEQKTAVMESLRGALQPITHSLPTPIHDLGISIIGETCYKKLLLDIDLESTECIKLAISKGLGIGIIAASSIVKVPQIIKLINSRSASGISFLSYLLETSAYLISLAYNYRQGFPFSTYGETGLIMVQNVAIAVLVLHYSGKQTTAAMFVAGLATSAVTLFSANILDLKTLSYLQAGAGVLGVASKIPQIAAVWQEGGTGQLSAFAVSLCPLPKRTL